MRSLFIGIYASYLDQYLRDKRQLGFKHKTEERILVIFDQFTVKRGETRLGITPELSQAWMKAGIGMSRSYIYHRAVLINQLASFLNEQGVPSYIMRLPVCKADFAPHIYSQTELNRIFDAADNLRARKGVRQIMFAIPALIRLLYATGLRSGEALSLTVGMLALMISSFLFGTIRTDRNVSFPSQTRWQQCLDNTLSIGTACRPDCLKTSAFS